MGTTRWRVEETKNKFLITTNGILIIAVVYAYEGNKTRSVIESKALAAQIVREHNAHAALVEALEELQAGHISEAWKKGEAAMQLAKGE